MFDARSILEGLVRGAAPSSPGPQQQGGGGIGDILNDLLKGAGANSQGGSGGGLGDILADIQRKLGEASQPRTGAGDGATGGGIGDILGQLKDKLGQAGGAVTGNNSGSITDILGQVLAQATQGAKEGAGKIGQATGATAAARDAIGKATGGQTPEDLLAKLQELVKQNPMAAGGAIGTIGGLLLGTRTGRGIAGGAARIGALALIGGLAYKAMQNYQAGKPLVTGATPPETAPQGSGFEPAAQTNDMAIHYIQAMVAAAAADGRIDEGEQSKIIGSLKQAGLDAEAEAFLANELNNPKTVAAIAAAAGSPEEAVQIYTAARIAIDPDTPAEAQFLVKLASALGIDPKLAAHIDATAKGASA